MGDYPGIAAFGGKVYGVWTEKPRGPNGSGGTASPSTHPGTVIKIGSADFKSGPNPSADGLAPPTRVATTSKAMSSAPAAHPKKTIRRLTDRLRPNLAAGKS